MNPVLVVVDHDRGVVAPASLEALTAGRALGTVEALTIGAAADGSVHELAEHGATRVHQVHHAVLTDYGPEAWGAVVAEAIGRLSPSIVLSCGTDRGNEFLAHAAARLDVPFAANCTDIRTDGRVELTRLRWGGSLLEIAEVDAPIVIASIAPHVIEAQPDPVVADVVGLSVEVDATLSRSVVRDRVERAPGVTLATAGVVVGGGRGVGSAAGFAPLEELAAELGGVVGCSRAVTNNGWRSHADQVGQTGTRIAPDVYFACGISGAIQHWVGAMASKHIIAINTDSDANIVTKSDYAVIGDLHEVVPAIVAEIRRRRDR